jgi:hypothetical protein
MLPGFKGLFVAIDPYSMGIGLFPDPGTNARRLPAGVHHFRTPVIMPLCLDIPSHPAVPCQYPIRRCGQLDLVRVQELLYQGAGRCDLPALRC